MKNCDVQREISGGKLFCPHLGEDLPLSRGGLRPSPWGGFLPWGGACDPPPSPGHAGRAGTNPSRINQSVMNQGNLNI